MSHKYITDSQYVRRSMIVLCLALILVYVILYYAKGDVWQDALNTQSNVVYTGDIVVTEISEDNIQGTTGEVQEVVNQQEEVPEEPDVLTGDLEFTSNEESSDEELTNEDSLLSGTTTYYGELDFVERLGISYDYALKDDKNIYYVNMGENDYDFADIARKLNGNLYVMNTDQEIIANGLFGDKITYINIPEYKNIKVLILLEIDNQSWLLAIDYAIYHQVKSYLKTLFID
ncbi:MAG TPA: hypothetical protein P5060_03920 [Candidatus Absconditabacterales bacterium]|nr:hypothetical protein [Candidatus Absconditabacterales bacterium]